MTTNDHRPHRTGSLIGVLRGLMLSENLGDVRDEIDFLCDIIGIPRFDGDYLDGWTDDDYRSVGIEPEDDDG